jgi:hypothetical protein
MDEIQYDLVSNLRKHNMKMVTFGLSVQSILVDS